MRTSKQRQQQPQQPQLSPQEQWQRDFDNWEPYIVQELRWMIERAQSVREKFIEKIAKGAGQLAHTVAWGENDIAADFEGSYANWVLSHYEDTALEFANRRPRERLLIALQHYVAEFKNKLLGDHLRANSTGQFHRAVESTERAAIARLHEKFERFVKQHERIEEQGNKLS